MAARAGVAYVDVRGDFSSLDRQVDNLGGGMKSKFAKFGRIAAAGVAAGAAGFGILAKASITAASDINESLSKNQQLFGRYSKSIERFSDSSAKSFGISKRAALEYTGVFGNLFRSMGLSEKASAGMSTELVKLAADMASFNNTSPEEALEAIRSGLVGETEPLRRFGVNMNDATLKAQALKMGLIKTTKEALDPQTKALAASELITKQTSKAHGDFARTSGGMANQTKILKARLEDASAALGARLLPFALKAATALNTLMTQASNGTGIFATLRRVSDDVVATFREWRPTLQDVWAAMVTVGGAAVTVFQTAFPALIRIVQGALGTIIGVVKIFKGLITLDFGLMWEGIKTLFSGALDFMLGIVQFFTAPFRALFVALLGGVGEVFVSGWNAIKGITVAVFDGIRAFFVAWWSGVTAITSATVAVIKAVLSVAWTAIRTAAGLAWDAIRLAILTPIRLARDALVAIWTAIRAAAGLAWGVFRTAASFAWEGIRLVILTPIRAARDGLAAIWSAVRSTAGAAWGALADVASGAFGAVRGAILTPIRSARDVLSDIWGQVRETAGKAWDKIIDGAKGFAGGLKDVIVNAFKAAANKVVDFVNKIIKVIREIPGVPDIPYVKGFASGGVVSAQALAQGGKVTRPIVMMGEEAPRHPEYVIPTNPAYRGRARDLLAQAASKIGFAAGGVLSRDQIQAVYRSVAGSGNSKIMAAIALAESGGRVDAIGHDPGGTQGLGLWQITTGFNDDVIARFGGRRAMLSNPAANARAADAIYDRQGEGAWVVFNTGAYKQFMDGGGGGGGMLGKFPGAPDIPSLGDLVGKLPGLGDLPGWLKGTGKYVLEKATAWMKDQLASLVPDLGGGIDVKVPGGIVALGRRLQQMGYAVSEHPAFGGVGGGHSPTGYHPQGRAIDVNADGWPGGEMAALDKLNAMLRKLNGVVELLWRVPGHFDHLHVAMKKGGIFSEGLIAPAMHGGGWVNPPGGQREMTANLLRGEYVLDPDTAAAVARNGGSRVPDVRVFIGDRELTDIVRVEVDEKDRQGAGVYRAGISR